MHGGARSLASLAVLFDTVISVTDTASAATTVAVTLAPTLAKRKAVFVSEVKRLKATGAFPDMANLDISAIESTLVVTTASPTTTKATGTALWRLDSGG